MKKLLLTFAFAAITLTASAVNIPQIDPLDATPYQSYRVSYFQIGIFPGLPASQNQTWVYGIKSGWPMCSGKGAVSGLEASWLGSLTEHMYGIQASWVYCQNKTFAGLQATLGVNVNTESFYGLQAAPVFCYAGDYRGVQASAVNVSGNYTGWQPAAIMNISKNFKGWQVAVIMNVAKDAKGLQSGLLNVADRMEGGQIGLLNVADRGIQFGLLNFMEEGFLKVCPLINFSL